MKFYGLIFLLLLGACADEAPTVLNSKENQKQIEERVIYGDDNRIEHYQASDALKSLAQSTVALVKSSNLTKDAQGKFTLLGSQFGSRHQLCASEPFREQTVGGFCSGFLVAPDLVVTAGHCVTSATDCQTTRFVFDFAVKAQGVEKKVFSTDEVYSCRDIVARDQANSGTDYAVIRLDRAVTSRAPLRIRRSGSVAVGNSIFVIGHPAGLPQKIAGGAQVRSLSKEYFTANLDTYGGNSGSAVFNALTNDVEGILVRGETDFTWSGNCSVSYKCENNSCRGEDVTRIEQVLKYIPALPETPAPGGTSSRYVSDRAVAIPDSPQEGIASSLDASEVPGSRKVQVELDLVHTYRGDLVVEMISPSGLKVVLHNRSGGSLDDLKGTYGLDLVSSQSLEALKQETKVGRWTLKVSDKAAVDTGTLRRWALQFVK